MENKKYLTEENYEKGKRKLKLIALIVLIVGILIGGSLITTGIIKQSKINEQYSEESKMRKEEQLQAEKQKLTEELSLEKQNLIASKTTLENKIKPVEDQIKSLEREPFKGFDAAYYERKDKIEELEKSIEADKDNIDVIEDALDEGFNHCNFSEAKNNIYTSKYCSLKSQISKKNLEIEGLKLEYSDSNKKFASSYLVAFYILGAFIIIASFMIAGSIYMTSKRREIIAFTTQQVMPVAKEGIEDIAPTIGKASATIMKEISPTIGNVAKEISKGIKEGLKDEEK